MSFNCSLVFAEPDEIYFFRHSEKLTGKNSALSEEGKARANNLVTFFKEYQNIHIFSSNYKRTLQTAGPCRHILYQPAYIWGLFNVKEITLELGKNFYI